MLKDTSTGLAGNDRFEGFGIDIINELSLLYGFKYEFVLQEDQIYGSPVNGTSMWNGLIGRVMSGVSFSAKLSEIGRKFKKKTPMLSSRKRIWPSLI